MTTTATIVDQTRDNLIYWEVRADDRPILVKTTGPVPCLHRSVECAKGSANGTFLPVVASLPTADLLFEGERASQQAGKPRRVWFCPRCMVRKAQG